MPIEYLIVCQCGVVLVLCLLSTMLNHANVLSEGLSSVSGLGVGGGGRGAGGGGRGGWGSGGVGEWGSGGVGEWGSGGVSRPIPLLPEPYPGEAR